MNGRVEEDEIPEEYCGLEGSTVQEQLTIVSSRLDQREADYDSLKTELNKTKEECINLQGNWQIRVQRKSRLQLFIQASWIVIQIPQKTSLLLSSKLKTEFTSPIAKSTGPELSDTTFFSRCKLTIWSFTTRAFTKISRVGN